MVLWYFMLSHLSQFFSQSSMLHAITIRLVSKRFYWNCILCCVVVLYVYVSSKETGKNDVYLLRNLLIMYKGAYHMHIWMQYDKEILVCIQKVINWIWRLNAPGKKFFCLSCCHRTGKRTNVYCADCELHFTLVYLLSSIFPSLCWMCVWVDLESN